MAAIDDAINGLSPEELDLLNSDPKMLTDFKNKYTQQPSQVSQVVKGAVGAALPSPAALSPIAPSPMSGSPLDALKGGAEAALQTLRDPSRVSPTISQIGTAASESQPATAAAQALQSSEGIPAPVTKFVTAALADPQTYLGLQSGELPAGVQKQLANLGETLTGVDAENFLKLTKNPGTVLSAKPYSVTGKAYAAAKQAAGLTDTEERILALSDGAKKRVYRQTMEKIDAAKTEREYLAPKTPQTGAPLQGMGGDELAPIRPGATPANRKPDLPTIPIDPTTGESPIKGPHAVYIGTQKSIAGHPPIDMYDVRNSLLNTTSNERLTLAGEPGLKQLENNNIPIVGRTPTAKGTPNLPYGHLMPSAETTPKANIPEDLSVADLLKAKKAGQAIAQSDPSASGLIQKEIHQKINPLLKQMAPDVYNAQQAVHLSKVKESFMNLFPQGKGMYKYIRTIGMLGGSLFHGIGMLESPVIAGIAALAGSTAAKIGLSPAGLLTASKALRGSLQNYFPLSDENKAELNRIQFKDTKYADKLRK